MATAGPGDGIGEREGADAAVQGPGLAAGAYRDRERSVMSGRSRGTATQVKKGLDSHATERVVSEEGVCRRFTNTCRGKKEKRQRFICYISAIAGNRSSWLRLIPMFPL